MNVVERRRLQRITDLLERAENVLDDDDPQTALALCDKAMSAGKWIPPDVRAFAGLLRAGALGMMDRNKEALSDLEVLLADPMLPDDFRPMLKHQRMRTCIAALSFQDALQECDELVGLDPQPEALADILTGRCEALIGLGRLTEAVAELGRIIDTGADREHQLAALLTRSDVLRELNELDEAMVDLRRYVDLVSAGESDPMVDASPGELMIGWATLVDDVDAMNRGMDRVLDELDDDENVARALEAKLQWLIDRNMIEAALDAFRMLRVHTSFFHDHELALRCMLVFKAAGGYEQALEISDELAQVGAEEAQDQLVQLALVQSGLCLLKLGRTAESVARVREYLGESQLEPTTLPLWLVLAEALDADGMSPECDDIMTQALRHLAANRQAPSSLHNVYLVAGRIQVRRDNHPQAVEWFSCALEAADDYTTAFAAIMQRSESLAQLGHDEAAGRDETRAATLLSNDLDDGPWQDHLPPELRMHDLDKDAFGRIQVPKPGATTSKA